nr:DUF3558 family protein [Rhodococcus sp. (in: high G+C Gram-positive bacteria)]
MGKKIAVVVLAVIALAGCSKTVQGQAVVEDGWHGQGVKPAVPSLSPQPSPSPKPPSSKPPTSKPLSSTPSGFDPCGFDEIALSIYVGVDPETKKTAAGGDGCTWTGDGRVFTAAFNDGLYMESLATTPGVSGLTEFDAGGQSIPMFVFEHESCITLPEIDGRTVQFTMTEEDFSAFCIGAQVATTLLVEDL